ncbi:MAG: hypothetical protein ACK4P1_03950 [Aggregatilineales bacterium]
MPPEESPVLESLRAVLIVAFLGAGAALLALTLLQWRSPRSEDPAWVSMTHPQRLAMRLEQSDTGGLLGDALIYPVWLIGVAGGAIAWRRGSGRALLALMSTALLGIAYAGSMALYNGAMVAVCGFSAMLCSGLVAFSLTYAARSAQPETTDRTDVSDELV